MNKSNVLQKVLAAFLIVLNFYSFTVKAQSTSCSVAATILPLNASCVNQAFSNNDDGLITASSSCSTSGTLYEDVFYRLIGNGAQITITISNPTQSGSFAVFSACGSGEIICGLFTGGATTKSIVFNSTNAVTYYVRIQRKSGTTTDNLTGNICASYVFVTPPANDNPCSAIAVPVNSSCTPVNYNLNGQTATSGVAAPGCGNSTINDVWYTAVVPASGRIGIIGSFVTGGSTDVNLAVYSGTCSSLTLVDCDDRGSTLGPSHPALNLNYTPNTTLWIRIWGGTPSINFEMCIFESVPPPSNDECSGATTIPVTPLTAQCTPITGTLTGATISTNNFNCGTEAISPDVWFKFTVPASGNVQITPTNIINTPATYYLTSYIGTCGSLGSEIICQNTNNSSVPNTLTSLTPGSTYFLRIQAQGHAAFTNTNFDLCVQETGPCGTPGSQDYCGYPALIVEGPGSFSSTTFEAFSTDMPGNLTSALFGAATIENNMWFQFTASGTTDNFNFTVNSCSVGNGIQAAVYRVSKDINGCCTGFTLVSNVNTALASTGTIAATGLTNGATYMLMVDGNGGSVCDFTVTNWNAVPTSLPIELIGFLGFSEEKGNRLIWKTSSERNNDYFIIKRSLDGVTFEEVGQIDGAGNSSVEIEYSFFDQYTSFNQVYYQLDQVDFDGKTSKSDIITLTKDLEENIVIWPNPFSNFINVSINSKGGVLELYDITGKILKSIDCANHNEEIINFDLSNLKEGLYTLKYVSPLEQVIFKRITKK